MLRDLIAHEQPLLILAHASDLVGDLGAARLHGKVRLAERHHRFFRISVLHDQIASVTRKVNIAYFSMRSFSGFDRHSHTGKMISDILAAIDAGNLCLLNHVFELVPSRIV